MRVAAAGPVRSGSGRMPGNAGSAVTLAGPADAVPWGCRRGPEGRDHFPALPLFFQFQGSRPGWKAWMLAMSAPLRVESLNYLGRGLGRGRRQPNPITTTAEPRLPSQRRFIPRRRHQMRLRRRQYPAADEQEANGKCKSAERVSFKAASRVARGWHGDEIGVTGEPVDHIDAEVACRRCQGKNWPGSGPFRPPHACALVRHGALQWPRRWSPGRGCRESSKAMKRPACGFHQPRARLRAGVWCSHPLASSRVT